jgi:hypothetical protein
VESGFALRVAERAVLIHVVGARVDWYARATANAFLRAGGPDVGHSARTVGAAHAATDRVKVRSALRIDDRAALFATSSAVRGSAPIEHPGIIYRIAKLPRVAGTTSIRFGFCAEAAIVSEAGRAVLPTNGANALISGLALRITKCAVQILVGSASQRLSRTSAVARRNWIDRTQQTSSPTLAAAFDVHADCGCCTARQYRDDQQAPEKRGKARDARQQARQFAHHNPSVHALRAVLFLGGTARHRNAQIAQLRNRAATAIRKSRRRSWASSCGLASGLE